MPLAYEVAPPVLPSALTGARLTGPARAQLPVVPSTVVWEKSCFVRLRQCWRVGLWPHVAPGLKQRLWKGSSLCPCRCVHCFRQCKHEAHSPSWLGLISPYSTAFPRQVAATLPTGFSWPLARTDRISSTSLSIRVPAISLEASTRFSTTTAPRCCSSRLGLRSRACRISSQCVVCRNAQGWA